MYTHGQTATPADTSDTRLTGGLRGRHACCSLSGRLNLSQCGSPPAAGPPVASRSHGDGRSSIPSLSSTGKALSNVQPPLQGLCTTAQSHNAGTCDSNIADQPKRKGECSAHQLQ